MQHPEEGTIHAWLDGELPADEAAAFEAHVAECAECAAAAAEARGLIAASSRIVSALDVVPGGVIPVAAPKRRAWYASTQLRAAAAVVMVAGASLLMMTGRERPQMDRIMSAPAVASAPRETNMAVPQAEAPAAKVARPTAKSVDMTRGENTANAPLRKQRATPTASAIAPVSDAAKASNPAPAPVPAAVPPTVMQQKVAADESRPERQAAPRRDSARARIFSSSTLNEVVVTGVAAAAVDLRVTRTDTIAGAIRTVYSVAPGVEVSLVESGERRFSSSTARALKNSPVQAPVPAVPNSASPTINTISWMQKSTGRTATLTGPLSKEELEALRQKLPLEKR